MLISTNTFTVIYVVYKITSNNNIYIYKLWGESIIKNLTVKCYSVFKSFICIRVGSDGFPVLVK